MYELKENECWIKDYEGRYFVNTDSEVWSMVAKKPKKIQGAVIYDKKKNQSTYRMFTAYHEDGVATNLYFHRVIAEAFIPNTEDKPTVNHKNGCKQDNSLKNLEWATWSEQSTHAYTELPRKDSNISILMSDETVRAGIMDDYLRYGVEKVSKLHISRYLNEKDFSRNGIPYELYKTTGLKCKSYLDKWILLLTLGCCIDNNKTLVETSRITGIHNTLICRIKSGGRFSNLMDIYNEHKTKPEYIDRHIAKISVTYNCVQ